MSSKLRRGRSIKFPKKHIKGIAGKREGAKKCKILEETSKDRIQGGKIKNLKERPTIQLRFNN